jgi:flagellar motor protein MotB
MFGRRSASVEDEDRKDIFAPVADLMVGVIFIFIILMLALVMNLRSEDTVARSEYEHQVARVHELEAENGKLAQANERLVAFVQFVRDSDVMRLMSQLASADQTRSQLLEEMRIGLSAAGIDVTVNSGAGTLALPARKLFDVGRADPTPEGRNTILRLGAVMSDVLPCYSVAAASKGQRCGGSGSEASRLNAVYIEGHTDVTPFGAGSGRFTDNWDLSAGRAIEAFKLVGTQYERLRNLKNKDGEALVGVSGYADTRPAVRDAPDRRVTEVTEKDRRIEVRVIMTTNEEVVESVLRELNDRLRQIDDLTAH